MNSKIKPDWLAKNSKTLIRAYTIAKLKQYDVNLMETAFKLLKMVDPDHATEEFAKPFSNMLQLMDKLRKKKLVR